MLGMILNWLKPPESPKEKKERKEREARELARKEALGVKIRLWRFWQYIYLLRLKRRRKRKIEAEKRLFERQLEVVSRWRELFYSMALDILFPSNRLESDLVVTNRPKKKKKGKVKKLDMEVKNTIESPVPELRPDVKKRPKPWSDNVKSVDVNSPEYKREKAQLDKLREITQYALDNDLTIVEANPALAETLAKKLKKCVCLRKPCVCGGDDGNGHELDKSKSVRKSKKRDLSNEGPEFS